MNAFVLVGGSFPTNFPQNPTHWMAVDGDWLIANNAVVMPSPMSQGGSFFNQSGLRNPYAPQNPHFASTFNPNSHVSGGGGGVSGVISGVSGVSGGVSGGGVSGGSGGGSDTNSRRSSEVNVLCQDIQKLRSELSQLKEMAASHEVPSTVLRSQSSVGTWAETPFVSDTGSVVANKNTVETKTDSTHVESAAESGSEGMSSENISTGEGLRKRKLNSENKPTTGS